MKKSLKEIYRIEKIFIRIILQLKWGSKVFTVEETENMISELDNIKEIFFRLEEEVQSSLLNISSKDDRQIYLEILEDKLVVTEQTLIGEYGEEYEEKILSRPPGEGRQRVYYHLYNWFSFTRDMLKDVSTRFKKDFGYDSKVPKNIPTKQQLLILFYLEKYNYFNFKGLGVNQERSFIMQLINRSDSKLKTYRREIKNEYADKEADIKYFTDGNLETLFKIFKDTNYSDIIKDIKEQLGKH